MRALPVDTGYVATWISARILEALGISRAKKLTFEMLDGRLATRFVGFAILSIGERSTVDEIVFAEKGDEQVLGSRALTGLNLRVDSATTALVPAGPRLAAVES